MPITGHRTPSPKSACVCLGHACSKVTPEIFVSTSIRSGSRWERSRRSARPIHRDPSSRAADHARRRPTIMKRTSAASNDRNRSRKSGFIRFARVREGPQLATQLPRHACAFIDGNRQPEVDVEVVGLLPRMEHVPTPVGSSCLARRGVHGCKCSTQRLPLGGRSCLGSNASAVDVKLEPHTKVQDCFERSCGAKTGRNHRGPHEHIERERANVEARSETQRQMKERDR